MSRETTIYEDLAAILLQFTKDVKEGSIATVPVEGEDLKVTNVIDASPQAIAFLQAEHMKLLSTPTALLWSLLEELLRRSSPRFIEGVDFQIFRPPEKGRSFTWKAQAYKFDFRSMRTSQTSNRRDPY